MAFCLRFSFEWCDLAQDDGKTLMAKYRFKTEQRFALWKASDRKCFWCGEPMVFREVTVDHIFPERLLNEPQELQRIAAEYGLGTEFAINDFCNWVPAHGRCNQEKGTTDCATWRVPVGHHATCHNL